jgi:hypothetical protein
MGRHFRLLSPSAPIQELGGLPGAVHELGLPPVVEAVGVTSLSGFSWTR